MKKIIISVASFILLTSSSVNKLEDDWVRIYCKPDIKTAIHNLKQLKYWIELDNKDNKINDDIFTEYHLAVQNTILSLEMILDNKGQCDTSDNKVYKLKYN
jgi:hypothetical protein